MTNPKQTAAHVIHPDKDLTVPRNPIIQLIAAVGIYGCIFALLFLDLTLVVYQNTYFRAMRIPLIPRKEYVVIERWKLPKLNLWQRINCIYCDYANGLIAWAKDVIGWTEIHSCAIKNSTTLVGQNHTDGYYERELFG